VFKRDVEYTFFFGHKFGPKEIERGGVGEKKGDKTVFEY